MNEKTKQIFELVEQVNQNTEYAAFFNYSGHVGLIEVYVTRSKEKFMSVDYILHHSLFMEWTTEEAINDLITELSSLLRVNANV